MKNFKSSIIVLLFLMSSISYGLDTNSIRYMPLQVGNYWVYNSSVWNLGFSNYWIDKCTVTGSIVYNNHIYYNISSTSADLFNGYFRVDSLTGSLYKYDPNNSCVYYYYDKLADSLSASNSDSIKNCSANHYRCSGTAQITLFGVVTNKLSFEDHYQGANSGHDYTRIYVKNYGFYKISASEWGGGGFGGWGITLKGCKINGFIHGDTSLVYVNNINTEIPNSFSLGQNYPNPFNPLTRIKFDIAKFNNKVQLKVFNIMGEEVSTLVNENLQPGTYEVTFDGSNQNSGIYFYQLVSGEFKQTRKLILLK